MLLFRDEFRDRATGGVPLGRVQHPAGSAHADPRNPTHRGTAGVALDRHRAVFGGARVDGSDRVAGGALAAYSWTSSMNTAVMGMLSVGSREMVGVIFDSGQVSLSRLRIRRYGLGLR